MLVAARPICLLRRNKAVVRPVDDSEARKSSKFKQL
jgi:hypothetical protein